MDSALANGDAQSWQERLSEDRQGGALRELRDQLAGMRAELRRRLDAGAAPDEFALAEKLLAAVEAADSAALTFWDKYNKG